MRGSARGEPELLDPAGDATGTTPATARPDDLSFIDVTGIDFALVKNAAELEIAVVVANLASHRDVDADDPVSLHFDAATDAGAYLSIAVYLDHELRVTSSSAYFARSRAGGPAASFPLVVAVDESTSSIVMRARIEDMNRALSSEIFADSQVTRRPFGPGSRLSEFSLYTAYSGLFAVDGSYDAVVPPSSTAWTVAAD